MFGRTKRPTYTLGSFLLSTVLFMGVVRADSCSEFKYIVENKTFLLKPFAKMHRVSRNIEKKFLQQFQKVERNPVNYKQLLSDIFKRNLDQDRYDFAEIQKLPISKLQKEAATLLVTWGLGMDFAMAFAHKVQTLAKNSSHLYSNARNKGPLFTFYKEKRLDDLLVRFLWDAVRPVYRLTVPYVSKYAEPKIDPDSKHYKERAEVVAKHPKAAFLFKALDALQESGLLMAYFLTMTHTSAVLLSEDGLLDDGVYKESTVSDEEVQLLVESVPFPHLSIRIGDKVYSYGYDRIRVTDFAIYVSSHNISDWFEHGDEALVAHKSKPEGFYTRTIQVVTLNLPADEVLSLKNALEARNFEAYRRADCLTPGKLGRTAFPYANNCSVMTLSEMNVPGIAKYIPKRIYDSSPSTVVMFLTWLNLLGSDFVSDSFVVTTGNPSYGKALVARNMMVNFLDAALHVRIWFSNQGVREVMHAKYDDMHFKDVEYQAELNILREEWGILLEAEATYKSILAPLRGYQTDSGYTNAFMSKTRLKTEASKRILPKVLSAEEELKLMKSGKVELDWFHYQRSLYTAEMGRAILSEVEKL